ITGLSNRTNTLQDFLIGQTNNQITGLSKRTNTLQDFLIGQTNYRTF
ncbi:uncharacterized protein, partial [Mytilus edulis]